MEANKILKDRQTHIRALHVNMSMDLSSL